MTTGSYQCLVSRQRRWLNTHHGVYGVWRLRYISVAVLFSVTTGQVAEYHGVHSM